MDYKATNAKLEEELQATKEELQATKEELQATKENISKYTSPASNSGADVITEAMRKGKAKSGSRVYNDDNAFNNSSHSLNNSSHSLGNETDLGGSENGKTTRVIVGRYADRDKVTTKQRFTTESMDKFKLQ